MAKTFLYRFFGIGKLPKALVEEYSREGLLFFDEGIRGTITYRDFRGDGWRYSNWKRQWFASVIILTEKRFVAYRLRHKVIEVDLDDPRLKQIEFSFEEPETLLAAFDANWFQPNWTGRIEYRFASPVSKPMLERLRQEMH
jgi:hypothetical protein